MILVLNHVEVDGFTSTQPVGVYADQEMAEAGVLGWQVVIMDMDQTEFWDLEYPDHEFQFIELELNDTISPNPEASDA
jgi:hypothetical protein